MKVSHVASLLTAASVLAGCGQSGTSIPQSLGGQQFRSHRSTSGDLIYALASGPRNAGLVFVLTYPDAEYVTQFRTPIKARLDGVCSDTKGDIFITQFFGTREQGAIYEYSHGATTPSRTLTLNYSDAPDGCAVNDSTGDLAVSYSSGTPGVAIFHNASGTPKYYTVKSEVVGQVAYDDSGNLFAIFQKSVYELPRGGKALTKIEFDTYINATDIQWDGTYLAIGNFDAHARWQFFRVAVSDFKGQIVSTITFDDLAKNRGSFWIQGDTIVIPVSKRKESGKMATYAYPQGGSPESIILGYKVHDLTVSVAPPR